MAITFRSRRWVLIVIVLVLVAIAAFVRSCSSGPSTISPLSKDVVMAREDDTAIVKLSGETERLLQPTLGEPLATGIGDGCQEGLDNFSIRDDYQLICQKSRIFLYSISDQESTDQLQRRLDAVREAMRAGQWECEYCGGAYGDLRKSCNSA